MKRDFCVVCDKDVTNGSVRGRQRRALCAEASVELKNSLLLSDPSLSEYFTTEEGGCELFACRTCTNKLNKISACRRRKAMLEEQIDQQALAVSRTTVRWKTRKKSQARRERRSSTVPQTKTNLGAPREQILVKSTVTTTTKAQDEVLQPEISAYYTMGKENTKDDPAVQTPTTSGENGAGMMLPELNRSESTDQETVEHKPSLISEFEKQVRPFIDLIDNLRHFGLDQDVSLPSIVVVGDQSAGKSSVLEAISGIQLPRGSGIVTRCPLELRLKSCPPGKEWRAKIKYQDSQKDNHEETLEDPNDIDRAVKNAQKVLAGDKKGISEELISLEVEAPNIPDLTLIDLPGITRVAAEGQSSNIPKQIKAMIQKYIRKEETVILAVVPANVDIVTTEALQMAKEVDPNGERTLGVVTKPDLVDKGTEEDVVAVVSNLTYNLKKGYTIVKCRGQQAVASGQSLAEAMDEEVTFFQCHEHFSQLDEKLYGIKTLSTKLTAELVNHIKKSLPTLKDDVRKKQEETRQKLHMLGTGLPETDEEKMFRLGEILQEFTDSVKNAAEGEYRGLLKRNERYRLFTSVRDVYKHFSRTAHNVTPRDGVAARTFKKSLEGVIKDCRGRELPRFMKFSVCESEIQNLVSGFHDPTFECLEKVGQLVGKVFAGLAHDHLGSYPELESKIKGLVDELRQNSQSCCEKELERLLEMEKNVFTQDSNYQKMIELILKKKEEQTMQVSRTGTFASDILSASEEELLEKDAEAMHEMILAYMEVCERRLIDTVPMNITYYLLTELVSNIRKHILQVGREEDAAGLLEEEWHITQERRGLKRKRERLDKAARELAKF